MIKKRVCIKSPGIDEDLMKKFIQVLANDLILSLKMIFCHVK